MRHLMIMTVPLETLRVQDVYRRLYRPGVRRKTRAVPGIAGVHHLLFRIDLEQFRSEGDPCVSYFFLDRFPFVLGLFFLSLSGVGLL